MIRNFADARTEAVFNGEAPRGLPPDIIAAALRRLSRLHSATELEQLRVPPGNRLEQLRGNLSGFWSIRVNDQYRVIFRFAAGNATEVAIVDYH